MNDEEELFEVYRRISKLPEPEQTRAWEGVREAIFKVLNKDKLMIPKDATLQEQMKLMMDSCASKDFKCENVKKDFSTDI